MSDGFKIATGALKANTLAVKSAAHDIAISGSVGAKATDVFMITQNAGTGSVFDGGGINATGAQNVAAQGNLQVSAAPTHLAISGNGFFVCSDTPNGESREFTRAGHFAPDKEGNLKNEAGLYLLGWETDETGEVPFSTNKSDIGALINMNVNRVSGLAKPTTNIQLGFNLPSGEPVGHQEKTSISVFDSLGAKHNLQLLWERTVITPATWTLAITSTEGDVFKGASTDPYSGATVMTVVFDGEGRPLSFDGGAAPPDVRIEWDDTITNADDMLSTIDLGEVGTLEGVSARAGEYQITKQSQNGREFGTFRNVNIDDDGKIFAVYSNGQSVVIGRIALANFAAPNMLESLSGNSYIETSESGTYVLSEAKAGGFGKIVSFALEASTVDLPDRLTTLIDLQNHFSANTKSIAAIKKEFQDLMQTV